MFPLILPYILPVLLLLLPQPSLAESQLPPLLTSKSFKQVITQSKLSLIEFYSPYCSHCNAFAPTWEETFLEFQNDSNSDSIKMYQVNCIESGDLCNDEKILAYPSLKIYGPDGFILNYPNGLKRTKENLIEFMKEQVLEIGEIGKNGKIKSKSQLITTEDMIKILGEVINEPILISFWPSYELEDLNKINWKIFEKTEYFEEGMGFQGVWSIVSNALNIKTGHFNCFKNKKICKEFGIKNDFKPLVKLFLPKLQTSKVISLDLGDADATVKDIVRFTKHTLAVSKFDKIDSIQLVDGSKANTKLRPLSSAPSKAENTMIYLYDDKLTFEEDFQLLPYLIPELASHESLNFYLSNDTNILKILEFQQRNIINALNNEKGNNFQFNEDKFTINTMSTLPTLITFKEYSLLSTIYQSFGPTDIRDERKVKQYIKENSTPFISELKSSTASSPSSSSSSLSSPTAMIIIDSSKEDFKQLDKFILEAHKYEELKSNHSYTQLLQDRSSKYLKANNFKQNNEYKKMVKTLRQEVKQPQYPTFTYLYHDISSKKSKLPAGIFQNSENYATGDVIIMKSRFYYTHDRNGAKLSADTLAETLSVIAKLEKGTVQKTLIKSPFGMRFRALDNIHQFGLIGWVAVLLFIGVAFKVVKAKLVNRIGTVKVDYLPMYEEKKD